MQSNACQLSDDVLTTWLVNLRTLRTDFNAVSRTTDAAAADAPVAAIGWFLMILIGTSWVVWRLAVWNFVGGPEISPITQ